MFIKLFSFLCLLILTLPVFSKDSDKAPRLGSEPRGSRERREDKTKGHLLAEPLFTTKKKKNETTGIGVNSYLWKASLETISFLPKKSTDPFGGLLITDWYSPPETPMERLKIEIIIIGRSLQTEALKVSIFREKRSSQGQWVSASVDPSTILKFEETILTRARELKVSEEIK